MSGKWMMAMGVGVVVILSRAAFSQRAAHGGAALPQAFLEKSDGTFERGWLKREGKQSTFVDMSGKTSVLDPKEKVQTLGQMNQTFQRIQRNILVQPNTDLDRYREIVKWAKSHALFEQALKYSEMIIRLNMSNPDPAAEENITWAKEQLASLKAGPASAGGESWTPQDVQKVRFALLPKVGANPGNLQVTFKNNAIRRFLEKMKQSGKFSPDQEREFQRSPATRQAQIIKRETGSEYQPDILIGRDPIVMMDYRKIVAPLVTRSCASVNCHGGGGTQFKLLPRANTMTEIYADFYALDTHRGESGAVINHDDPERSLLLNYLLSPNLAVDNLNHPKTTPPIIPTLKTKKDPRYTQLVGWLKSLPPQPIEEMINQSAVSTTQPAGESENTEREKPARPREREKTPKNLKK